MLPPTRAAYIVKATRTQRWIKAIFIDAYVICIVPHHQLTMKNSEKD